MPHRVHHNFYHALRLKELRRLYWAHTVRELASSMVTIFVPIFLYKLGYSIQAILGYFLLATIFWGITLTPLMRWTDRLGFNRSMGVGLIIQAMQILMLATLTTYHWPLWLIAFAWGVSISLYWLQFRACFARSLLHRKVAPAVGISSALLMFALGAAPAIGGAIASWYGISILYIFAMLCFVAAAAPLFTAEELIKDERYRLRDVSWRKIWRDLAANMGSEIDASVAVNIWPLFIFLLIPTYVGVGLLSSASVFASIIIAFYVGRRRSKEITGYLKNGSSVISLTNAIRLISQTAGQIAGVNFFNGLGQALMVTPFYSRYYENAEREPLLPYAYAMQMISMVGDLLLFGLLLILSLFLPDKTVLLLGLVLGIPAGYSIRLIRVPKGLVIDGPVK